MDYFSHPFLSNSKLNEYARDLGMIAPISSKNRDNNYRLGTLFDFWITENERVDRLNKRLLGTDYVFSDEEMEQTELMANSFHKSGIFNKIKGFDLDFQKEIYDENFSIFGVNIPFKGKLDIYLPGWVIDLKTTDASNNKQFEDSCEMFGYYRQMYLYMKLTGAKHSTLVGVSKRKPYKTFEVHFNSAHPMYNATESFLKKLIGRIYLVL